MAIYGIGAKFGPTYVESDFIKHSLVGTGWDAYDAPDLHAIFSSMEIGDIVYIKACSWSSNITVKGIGIISDDVLVYGGIPNINLEIGRNVRWIYRRRFVINKPPNQKNNVRANTVYQEFHPDIAGRIMSIVDAHLLKPNS